MYKTDAELKTQVDAVIKINGNREITPPLDNSIRTNFIDSKLSLAGGNALLNLTGYTTELTPTDNKHLTPKKYVDDQITASVSDTAYNATSWNGVTTIAPSKNAVRDEFENRVAKTTGNILFNFHSASAFDITNDGAGGNYSKGYLYFDSSEIEFGWGINYMSVGSVTGFTFRNAGGVITMPSTTGTIALTSDVSAVISDTAYAGSWNGVTGIAPSKNAVYDKIELISADITAAIATAEAYADSLVVGLWDDRGSFDASVNAYPSSGGSGSAGAIKKGDIWTISVAGTLPTGQAVSVGDTVRALQDTPGNTQANWAIAEGNLGYTPVTNARTLTINGTAFDLSANRTWTVGDALVANPLSQFAATTSLQLKGVISDETGSGSLVFADTPTLVTPVLGVASATSVNKVILTAPATTATLTLADSTTTAFTGGGTIGLGGFTLTVPATGTAALLGTANVFTADQSHTGNIIPTATNTYDFGANTTTGDWKNLYTRIVTPADVTTSNTAGTPLILSSSIGNGTGTEAPIVIKTPILGSSGVAQTLGNTMLIGKIPGSATQTGIWCNIANGSQTTTNYAFFSDGASGSTGINSPSFTYMNIGGSTIARASSGLFTVTGTLSVNGNQTFIGSRTLGVTASTGTNAVGNPLTIAPAIGTGTGTPSSLIFQTPTIAAAGTTPQALATRLTVNSSSATYTVPVGFPSYTVGTLPSAATAGQMIYVSDEAGGAVMAFSDGTNFRRVTDRTIVA